jgi:FKBP-type peptidyl-prolyl cis-trans isomerase
MLNRHLTALAVILGAAACGGGQPDAGAPAEEPAASTAAVTTSAEWSEIVPGLSMRILEPGDGDIAAPGQLATVHYTGWLHDPEAPDGRGDKFDSSVDRGQYFEFPLGAGRVIKGWDQGVAGMSVGETRELLIAPEMAYGDRQVGNLIPPGSTLLFEVELAGLDGNVPDNP